MNDVPYEVVERNVPLLSLATVLYWAVACYFLLRVVHLYLERTISAVVALFTVTMMLVVFVLFGVVNLPILDWWGAHEPVLKIASWAGMAVLLIVPTVLRFVHSTTDRQMRRHAESATIERARRDIVANPTNPVPHLVLADIYERRGDLEAAIAEVEKALAKQPAPAIQARLNKLRGKLNK